MGKQVHAARDGKGVKDESGGLKFREKGARRAGAFHTKTVVFEESHKGKKKVPEREIHGT